MIFFILVFLIKKKPINMSEIIKMNVHYITHVNKNKSTLIFFNWRSI